MRRLKSSTLVSLAAVCLLGTAAVVVLVAPSAGAQELRRVLVTNFPDVFDVRGEVEIRAQDSRAALARSVSTIHTP